MSVNQTLSRTILTSLTVFMVLLILFFFGGAVIHDFTFALLGGNGRRRLFDRVHRQPDRACFSKRSSPRA